MKHKWKRLLCIGAALTLTGQVVPLQMFSGGTALVAHATDYEEYTEDGIIYAVYEDHAEVLKAATSISKANILAEVKGKPVTKIGEYAFRYCAPNSITFPDSITKIDRYAFCESRISSITIPDHITKIGEYAFEFCINLTSVTIPDSVESINGGAFYGCEDLESVSIGKNVNYIGKYVFGNCPSLGSVSVDSQNDSFLYENGAVLSKDRKNLVILLGTLTEYEIPDGVEKCKATSGHENLKRITVPSSVTEIDFYSCEKLEETALGNGIVEIDDTCFYGCKSLKTLVLPASVQSVEDKAFKGCDALSALSFENPFCEIGEIFSSDTFHGTIIGYTGSTAEAFANENGYPFVSLGDASEVIDLSGLEEGVSIRYQKGGLTYDVYSDRATLVKAEDVFTDLVIPEKVLNVPVTVIASSACEKLTKLKSVQIPQTVIEIEYHAFDSCESLEQIQFPEGLLKLDLAFWGCKALTTVDLPASLKDYYGSFSNCLHLTQINAAAESEYFASKNGVLYSKDMTKLYQIPGAFSGSYTLPDSVEVIHDWAADSCKGLTNFQTGRNTNLKTIGRAAFVSCIGLTSFSMPDTVTEINGLAFKNCYNLKQIRLSNHLQEIPFQTFDNCNKLESFNVPASVETIGTFALGGAESLKSLVFQNPKTEINKPISGTEFNGTVYGYANSTAQAFAEKKGYPFVDITTLTDETVDGIKYQIRDGKATVVGYEDGITEAYIPEYVFGAQVIAIADNALQDCTTLKTLTLPESLTAIGDFAFDSCYNLEGKINIPDSVETIGVNAFAECYKVTSFDFGEGLLTTNPKSKLREIGVSAFSSCTSLVGVFLPPSVKTIGTSAFEGCDSMVIATCGSNVETIGADAFAECKKLLLLSLGSNLKTLGDRAYENCSELMFATIPETTESIGESAFAGCSRNGFIIYFDNPNTEIYDAATTVCSVKSPVSFKGTIYGYSNSTAQAYAEKYGYTFKLMDDDSKDEVMRDKITYKLYDDHAEVIACEDTVQKAEIQSVVRGLPVTVIAEDAFSGITALETVVIPDSVLVISDFAFSDCTALSAVYFGEGIQEIGGFAFSNTAIPSLTLPDSVRKVGMCAFDGAASLRSVMIGKGLTELGDGAFSFTDSLETFEVDAENRNFIVQDGLLYSADSSRIYAAPCDLEMYNISGSVKDISYAFRGLKSLKSVTIPNSAVVTDGAFQGCTALENAGIFAESIGKYMFADCTALREAWIYQAKNIDMAAFQNCFSLHAVFSKCETIDAYAFGACPNLETIGFGNPNCVISSDVFNVNDSSLTESPFTGTICGYEGSTAQTFADENSYPFDSYGKIYGYLIYKVTDSQEITICRYLDDIPEKAEIPAEIEGLPVTEIHPYAFQNCYKLKEIQFPDTLKTIGIYAFDESGLERVTIPASVETIDDHVFNCTKLSEITIPASVKTIGKYAFHDTLLKEVTVPATVKTVGKDAFSCCDALEKVTVGAETIEESGFFNCDSLTDVTILDTVKTIGQAAFRLCDALTEITIPDTVELVEQIGFNINDNLEKVTVGAKTLGSYQFSCCPKLKEVIITDHVETIGEQTFAYDDVLETVEYPASVKSIGAKQFVEATAMNAGGTVIIRNPECMLDENMLTSDFKGTVYGYPHSTAQTYCETYGFKFAAICNVSYDGNGAKGEMEGCECFGDITLPECGFTAPTGKKFAGWTTGENEIVYPAGTVLTLTEDTVLKANWQTATVTVTLDANGGTGTAVKSAVVSGSAFTFPNCTFTAPEGKQFVCWQIGELTYQPGDSLKITKDTTVKAVWEDISVTVLVGDVSGDGIVDQADAMLLARYAAAWEGVELDLKAADLNDDGTVDNADAMILSRYVAGWEGYDQYIVTKTV